MRVREWVNNNSVSMMGAAVALLAVALGIVFVQMRGPGSGSFAPVYFMDLETREVFAQSGETVAPVTAPSGGRGVRAHLYTCSACDPDAWFGYLETFSEQARRMYLKSGELPERDEDHLVRDLNNGPWVPYFSSAGERIIEQSARPCPGEDNARKPCLP